MLLYTYMLLSYLGCCHRESRAEQRGFRIFKHNNQVPSLSVCFHHGEVLHFTHLWLTGQMDSPFQLGRWNLNCLIEAQSFSQSISLTKQRDGYAISTLSTAPLCHRIVPVVLTDSIPDENLWRSIHPCSLCCASVLTGWENHQFKQTLSHKRSGVVEFKHWNNVSLHMSTVNLAWSSTEGRAGLWELFGNTIQYRSSGLLRTSRAQTREPDPLGDPRADRQTDWLIERKTDWQTDW